MGRSASETAVMGALNRPMPDVTDLVEGSPYCTMHQINGEILSKEVTVTGTGGVVSTNVFQFTGPVELHRLWGVVTDVSNVVTVQAVSFDVFDGANSVDVTAVGGVDLSATVVESTIIKTKDETQALVHLKADQVRVASSSDDKKPFKGIVLGGKAATTCYVRLRVTTDVNTNVSLRIYAAWSCLDDEIPGSMAAA